MYGLAPIENHLYHPQLPASKTQGAGLHKFEATVGKVKNKMLPNPPLYGYQNDRLLMLIAAMYDKCTMYMYMCAVSNTTYLM